MPAPIDFYFDFSSPYGYIAAHKIEALAARHGRTVNWRPTLLGAIFRVTGSQPLPGIPLKGEYALRDFRRSALFHGVPYRPPSKMPVPTLSAVRAFYWSQAKDAARSVALAKALYNGYFQNDRDISDALVVVAIAVETGFPADEVQAGLNDPAVKELTKRTGDEAVARGVFGSPYLIVDGEPFWGMDRFDQVDRWLATGGW